MARKNQFVIGEIDITKPMTDEQAQMVLETLRIGLQNTDNLLKDLFNKDAVGTWLRQIQNGIIPNPQMRLETTQALLRDSEEKVRQLEEELAEEKKRFERETWIWAAKKDSAAEIIEQFEVKNQSLKKEVSDLKKENRRLKAVENTVKNLVSMCCPAFPNTTE